MCTEFTQHLIRTSILYLLELYSVATAYMHSRLSLTCYYISLVWIPTLAGYVTTGSAYFRFLHIRGTLG